MTCHCWGTKHPRAIVIPARYGTIIHGEMISVYNICTRNKLARKLELPYEGPYIVTDVFRNGTLRVQIGPVEDRVNIRNVAPYTS